jgi:hypothetical protein
VNLHVREVVEFCFQEVGRMHKNRVVCTGTVFVAALCLASGIQGQQKADPAKAPPGNTGRVEGTVVRGATKTPIAKAKLKLTQMPSMASVVETQTDERGRYSLVAKPGEYSLVVEIKGLNPPCVVTAPQGKQIQDGKVGGVTLKAGGVETYTFHFNCDQ